jgi:hypothetical protein
MVVVVRGGAVRCVAGEAVADLVAGAVTLATADLEETPTGTPPHATPPVVVATVDLRHPARVSRLASRFLRRRLEGSATTLVLRSRSVPERGRAAAGLSPVAALPVAEVAVGATFDLIVPVGEPGRRRYPCPVLTLVVASALAPVAVARRLVDHQAFLGAGHCAGDAALVEMATSGQGTAARLDEALEAHEAAMVVDMLRDVVRSPC